MALPQLWVALTAVEAVGWSPSRSDVSAIVGSEMAPPRLWVMEEDRET